MVRAIFFLIFAIIFNTASAVAQSDGCSALLDLNRTDIGVDFTPGVDVRGNSVVPADAPGSFGWRGNSEFSFTLEFDLARRYGLTSRGMWGSGHVRVGVGEIVVRGNEVFLNGHPLTGEDRSAVVQACRQR